MPVRERLIPKANGKVRMLGIATARDRVVQASLKLVLEPIFEADFQPCCYGFRPKRRAQDAIAEIHFWPPAPMSGCSKETSRRASTRHHTAPSAAGVWSKRSGSGRFTLIRRPFRRPERTWTASSSPRFTRCKTVWRTDAEGVGGFEHGEPARRGVFDEAGAQFVGDADAPGGAGGELFAGDEPVGQPAVHGGGDDAEDLGCFGDGDELAVGGSAGGWWRGIFGSGGGALHPVAVKRSPVALSRPWRFKMPAMVASG